MKRLYVSSIEQNVPISVYTASMNLRNIRREFRILKKKTYLKVLKNARLFNQHVIQNCYCQLTGEKD